MVKFEDIKIEVPGKSNASPLEVTVFEGVEADLTASSKPTFYRQDRTSDKPGISVVGYVNEKGADYIVMTSDKLSGKKVTMMGGWKIYEGSIHSIRQL